MDRSSRQKTNKATLVLNDIVDHLDLAAIYKTSHPKPAEYTFFSSVHGTFFRVDDMPNHKTNLRSSRRGAVVNESD